MGDVMTLVIGLGKTGLSIARYLTRKKQPFMMMDTRTDAPDVALFREKWPDAPLYLGSFPLEQVAALDRIIVSPGVPLDIPVLQQARFHGVSIIGDIECFAREVKAPVIAITGTNGKSTVTSLCGEMARAAAINVAVAGNIGTPVLDMMADFDDAALWVLELSSFQLDLTYSLAPVAATILNISPDHLDRHGTMEAYRDAKQRIYRHAQVMIYNHDDNATWPLTQDHGNQEAVSFSSQWQEPPEQCLWQIKKINGEFAICRDDEVLIYCNEMSLKGIHNWQNALAACALAEAAGIPRQAVVEVLKTFKSLPHRCEWIRTIDGVEWLDDSKGTNIGATIAAILGNGPAISGKIVLIAGGLGKGADFSELLPCVKQYVKAVVLIGQDAPLIRAVVEHAVLVIDAKDMHDAVEQAGALAGNGDMVLLSPACASQDMFRDYNHRGDVFAEAVRAR